MRTEAPAPPGCPGWCRAAGPVAKPRPRNPFGDDEDDEPVVNPFAPASRGPALNPFATDDDAPAVNPFAPAPKVRPAAADSALPKLRLLARGLGVFGSLREGAARGRGAGGVRPVRAAVRVPARAAHPRPVSEASGLAVARGDHLHRDHGRRPEARAGRDAGRGGLRGPGRPRIRRRRDVPGGRRPPRRDQRADARRSGSAWASWSRRRTSGSRSCVASSGEPPAPGAARGRPGFAALGGGLRRSGAGGEPARVHHDRHRRPVRPATRPVHPRSRRAPANPSPPIPAPSPSGARGAVEDPALLAVLPATVDGIPVTARAAGVRGRLADSGLRRQRRGRGLRHRRGRQRPRLGRGGETRRRGVQRRLVPRLARLLQRRRLRAGGRRRRERRGGDRRADRLHRDLRRAACARTTPGSRTGACSSRCSRSARAGSASS